jgi:hypothetical protein
MVASDDPTTLRMGFGYPQARASGAPFRQPRSPSAVNYHWRESAANKDLRALVNQFPSLAPIVQQRIIERRGYYLSAYDILLEFRRDFFRKIIADFGGADRFAEATGISRLEALTIREAFLIPPTYWPQVLAAASKAGLDEITLKWQLAFVAGEKRQHSSDRQVSQRLPGVP